MGWLVDRLTPYKQSQPRWHDLAVALETYWDTYHTPAVERIEHMRSVFTAGNEDVEALLKEAGVQFEVAVPVVRDNLAFAYSWRAYEIHRKDRQETLEQILQRDYSGVFVRWLPLYAPKDVPYGERFLSEQDLAFSRYTRDDVYKTYRGAVQVNLSGLQLSGVTAEQFSAAVRRKLDALRPAHVVYDGEYFFQAFRAEIALLLFNGPNVLSRRGGRLLFSLRALFDDTPGDEMRLDCSPVSSGQRLTYQRQAATQWQDMPLWCLDAGSMADGVYWRLEGKEGHPRAPMGALGSWSAPASTLLLHANAEPGVIQGAHATVTAFEMVRRFDAMRADDVATDYEALSSAKHGVNAHFFTPWSTLPAWRLDMGAITPDGLWPLPGIEGDVIQWVNNAGTATHRATKPAHFYLSGNKNSVKPTFKSAYWLQFVTDATVQPALTVQGEHNSAQSRERASQPITVTRQRTAPAAPCMDDVPADFAPLDMTYEVYA